MRILSSDTSHNDISFDEEKLGDSLRGERATLGKSLLDVQRDLHIKADIIAAIEACDVSGLGNPSFVAGYVRSYARYLGLDPETVFTSFCREANFQSSREGLGKKSKPSKNKLNNNHRPITSAHNWEPRLPGQSLEVDTGARAGQGLIAAAPAIVLALVVFALGYGVWFVIQDIQRVEFAPVDDAPIAAIEPDGLGAAAVSEDGFSAANIQTAGDPSALYDRIELDVPIVQPRDGPIFAINPDAEAADTLVAAATPSDPIVSETPHIPSISIVAQQEAWVRVYQDDGTIVFEKLLAAGEQHELPEGVNLAMLRAGNATSVYVMIDDKAYGPVSASDSVISGVSLAPTKIAQNLGEVENPSVALQVAAQAWRAMNVARLDQ